MHEGKEGNQVKRATGRSGLINSELFRSAANQEAPQFFSPLSHTPALVLSLTFFSFCFHLFAPFPSTIIRRKIRNNWLRPLLFFLHLRSRYFGFGFSITFFFPLVHVAATRSPFRFIHQALLTQADDTFSDEMSRRVVRPFAVQPCVARYSSTAAQVEEMTLPNPEEKKVETHYY